MSFKERPILFNTEMVRAILDGRKTQTRRALKVQPSIHSNFMGQPLYEHIGKGSCIRGTADIFPGAMARLALCPFGITLEITDVRVQRLLDISEEDAKAEGVTLLNSVSRHDRKHRVAFENLWHSIYGDSENSWHDNPWVWAITFKVINPTEVAAT